MTKSITTAKLCPPLGTLAYLLLKSSPLRHWVCIGFPAHEPAFSHGLLPFTTDIQHIPTLISAFFHFPSNDLELSGILIFSLSRLPKPKAHSHDAPHIFQVFDSSGILRLP